MTKRMLIDATDAEETRVVVLDGTRLEEFDVETSTKKQLKGNIYLAKVVRVEPSLQAAFVEYGGNRHGFLAFGEIHPDYYQIPVADRQRLIAAQAEEARLEEEEEDRAAAVEAAGGHYEPPRPAEPPTEEAGSFEPHGTEEFGQPDFDPPESFPEAATPRFGEPEAGETEFFETTSGEPTFAEHDAPGPDALQAEAPGTGDAGADAAEPVLAPAADIAHAAWDSDAAAPAPHADAAPTEADDAAELPRAQPARIAHEERHGAFEPEATDSEPAALDDSMSGDEAPTEPALDATEAAETTEPHASNNAAANGQAIAEPAVDLLPPETVGGETDTVEDVRDRRIPPKFLRNYKIQEVIKRRQILLVQVVKEERGSKGAALTTYLSLAGRFCVLMPNSPRGGGISRKITSAADRKRLKEITSELEIPSGMGLIVRTAGANRPRQEIRRDCEYLLRLWDDIREHTMQSVAPALIYEEANLIKRAIRDVYSRDVDEITVDGQEAWQAARNFMNMLMPSHVRKVVLHKDDTAGGGLPLFAKHQVDAQLDAMLSPTVQLKSGGYLVINQAEALVAIDVNSGRSTRERNIEETALRTNLEAADEVARQLRLRDLAGLIVIDFIDMEAKKHNAMVERRMKDALKNDRARIQVGHISHFGLLEMSRQRLRPSLAETNFVACPHCAGLGLVRGTESAAIHVLRGIEEEAAKQRAAEIMVHVATPVLMYLINHKRERVAAIERRYAMRILFGSDTTLSGTELRIDRLRAQIPRELPREDSGPVAMMALPPPLHEPAYEADLPDQDDETPPEYGGAVSEVAGPAPEAVSGEAAGTEGERKRRRRRRRRGGRREDGSPAEPGSEEAGSEEAGEDEAEPLAAAPDGEPAARPAAAASDADEGPAGEPGHVETGVGEPGEDAESAHRRRSRRGGRRRRRDTPDAEGALAQVAQPGSEQPELPAYVGPTPADPFAGQTYDIFDVMDAAETRAAQQLAIPARPAAPRPAPTRPAPVRSTIAPLPPPIEVPPAPITVSDDTIVAHPPIAEAEVPETVAESANGHEAPAVNGHVGPDDISAVTPEPSAPITATEPVSEPALKPIVVGSMPAEEPKRGWWRR